MEEKKGKKQRDYKKEYENDKKNKYFVGLNFSRSTDADIISYLDKKVEEGKSRLGIVKEALREKISRDKEV